MKFNQAPLFLLMNPKPAQGSKELPVLIHESEAHTLDGQSKMIFVQLAFQASKMENLRRCRPYMLQLCDLVIFSFFWLSGSLALSRSRSSQGASPSHLDLRGSPYLCEELLSV